MRDMRKKLDDGLRDAGRSAEEQEKTIEWVTFPFALTLRKRKWIWVYRTQTPPYRTAPY